MPDGGRAGFQSKGRECVSVESHHSCQVGCSGRAEACLKSTPRSLSGDAILTNSSHPKEMLSRSQVQGGHLWESF